MNINDLEGIVRRKTVVFLLVDTSGSMDGVKIGAVNSAIEEMKPLLKEISDSNADAEINLAVLEFSTGCKWVTPEPQAIDTFFWTDLKAGGVTDMGAAFIELESKLSKTAFMKNTTGAYMPVILLLSDGAPTDAWQKGLDVLKNNNWYRNAAKIAIAVGTADQKVLAEFTGNVETVVQVNGDREVLKKMMSNLVVASSTIISRSKPIEDIKQNNITPEEASDHLARAAVKAATEKMDELEGFQNNFKSAEAADAWDDDFDF